VEDPEAEDWVQRTLELGATDGTDSAGWRCHRAPGSPIEDTEGTGGGRARASWLEGVDVRRVV
jgi:hypothetical protein